MRFNEKHRAIIAFLSCLVIVFTTLAIFMSISEKQMRAEAYKAADIEANSFENGMNLIFLSNDWIMNSFLASIADIDTDESDNASSNKIVLRPVIKKTLDRDAIAQMLSSFMEYNYETYSIVLIFEPGVLQKIPSGIAYTAYSQDIPDMDLLENYDIYNTDFYRHISKIGKTGYTTATLRGQNEKTFAMGIPIYDEDNVLVGQCWSVISLSYFSQMMEALKAQSDYSSFILSADSTIVCSENPKYNGLPARKVLQTIYPGPFPQEWYDRIMEIVGNEESKEESFHSRINGKNIVTYSKRIGDTDCIFVTVKTETRVIKIAKEAHRRLAYCFGGGLLLLALCLMYLYRSFRNEYKVKNKMEQELALASDLQHSLLTPNPDKPAERYDIYGFQRPAKSVGGDLYCYFVKGNKLHFCIGDVSGKGVSSALLMSEITSLYKYIAGRNNDTASIVRALNDSSMDNSFERNICTMIAGILNLDTGHLDFCNAGHNPFIIITKDGANFVKMKPNTPLYAFDGYDYQAQSIELKSGDELFFYTDGVTDAMNSKKQFLGGNAILQAVGKNSRKPFPRLVDSMLKLISDFSRKTPQYDDITMLCIKYKGK